jgi:galactose mutarotase-like enzyme
MGNGRTEGCVPPIKIASQGLCAEIAHRGAELVRLADGHGRELLWSGDPHWWAGRSPLLFPIVGRVPGDRLQIDGRSYGLPQHGFARTSDFELVKSSDTSCTFELRSNADTLQRYPREFTLRVSYRIDGPRLSIRASVSNDSDKPMPFSLGFLPAFRWPLPHDPRRADYEICLEADESAPVRRAVDGLLIAKRAATPVENRVLHLADELFEPGAIIFDTLNSRALTYGPRGVPALRLAFPNLPHLGIWTKVGAPFLCIEPWQGYAAPAGFTGELKDKPGVISLPAGGSAAFEMTIEPIAP